MESHVLPLRIYFGVFAALLVLTGVTFWVAGFDLGALNTLVALSIAGFKALLVVLYFMHVRYSGKLVWIAVAASVYWLVILFGFLMSDYVTRLGVEGWA